MTATFRLSGYVAHPAINQQNVSWQNPTWWIHDTAHDIRKSASKMSGSYLDAQFNVINTCAQEIISSVGPGRAVDAQEQLIDNSTQRDELIQLAIDMHEIVENVRTLLKTNLNLPRQSLEQKCERSVELAYRMLKEAATLQNRINAETKALTDQLLSTIKTLPKECLGIVAQYSIL